MWGGWKPLPSGSGQLLQPAVSQHLLSICCHSQMQEHSPWRSNGTKMPSITKQWLRPGMLASPTTTHQHTHVQMRLGACVNVVIRGIAAQLSHRCCQQRLLLLPAAAAHKSGKQGAACGEGAGKRAPPQAAAAGSGGTDLARIAAAMATGHHHRHI